MDNKSKRIGTFKQFLNEQRQKKINEANVNIECDWWDSCIVEVMQELEAESNGILEWDTIISFCKQKWAILGRTLPQPENDSDLLLTEHIKDLIFYLHGTSFYTDWKCDYGWDNQQVHSKGLVIEELAAEILNKVREKTKPLGEPDTGNPTGTLSDREKATLVPMKPAPSYDCEDEDCEDLPYESHKVKPVKGFKEYTKLNETVGIIEISCQDKCIQYCLDKIKEEVGSYNPDEIFIVASQAVDPKVKARIVLLYVKDMVIDYLSSEKAQLAVVNTNGKKGKDIPKEALEKGLDVLYHDIADEVLVKIAEINGITVSDGETE